MIHTIQGYLVISPNEPSKRGLLFFTLDAARKHKQMMDELVNKWDDGKTFNKEYWIEKPLPWVIHELVVGKEVTI